MSTTSFDADAAVRLPVDSPSDQELVDAYRVAVRSRCLEEHVVRLVSRGEIKFGIWGPGEEVHGTAAALALSRVAGPERLGMVPHYRSGSLVSAWCSLNGVDDFNGRMLRQQFSRATDTMSGGRQMVYHLHLPEVGVLPVQSPVGMQLGKAAGYALGFRLKGIEDGLAVAIIGDGTSAEGDLHDAMNAASVWRLPVIYIVTDNGIAISTPESDGRGIRDFRAYADAFDVAHVACDGRDFDAVFQATLKAARIARDEQRPVLMHVHDLPRFNGHSSAADVTFDLSQPDPLIDFGESLVERGLLEPSDIMRRKDGGQGRDFFGHHELGRIMSEEDVAIRQLLDEIRDEPHPDPSTLEHHIYPPFPEVNETPPGPGQTCVSYAGAIRSALDKLISRRGGHALGQDIGRLGGVMTATAGLRARHPDHVVDSPLNEPLICGVSTGLALHEDLMGLPEIQFGDYSLNAFHWIVYWGTLHWSTLGKASAKLMLRMPTDPFGGGAMYHSMSVDGYFTPVPGLVVVMPSTSFDAHGLMLTAGEYDGPVICLEPKWMYRQTLGPAFPDEPTDAQARSALKKRIMRGEVPDLPDVRVPFGKAALRREGRDVTVVAWGRAVWTCMDAASTLAEEGIEVEVIDLRTLVPPDLEGVAASVERTGRLVVAAEDRSFAGFQRAIQGAMVERFPGLPSRALGQKNVPAIAQSLVLEDAAVLQAAQVVDACRDLTRASAGDDGAAGRAVVMVPHRYWIS